LSAVDVISCLAINKSLTLGDRSVYFGPKNDDTCSAVADHDFLDLLLLLNQRPC
jgi:hypothetical protein